MLSKCYWVYTLSVDPSHVLGHNAGRLVAHLDTCGIPIAYLYSIYVTLSNEIHGSTRYGPGVRLYRAGLTPEQQCLLWKLAKDLNIVVID